MSPNPVHQLNRAVCQADSTYSMTVKEIRIVDTGKGAKSVAGDPDAVLRKIEAWHQGHLPDFG